MTSALAGQAQPKEMPTVMIRRAADVVYVWCAGCTREQAIAVARKAIAP